MTRNAPVIWNLAKWNSVKWNETRQIGAIFACIRVARVCHHQLGFLVTKRCQKVQLPAALLTCFLCALTVFCVNVQHFPVMVSVWISSFGRTKLWFLWIGYEDKWFIILEHATAATSFARHLFNIWTFLCVSTRQCPGSPCSQNGCTAAVGWDSGLHRTAVLYPQKRRTLWTPDFNTVIVRLRTSCICTVVRLCDFVYRLISQ